MSRVVRSPAVMLILGALCTAPAGAKVILEFRLEPAAACPANQVCVDVYARTDQPEAQGLSSVSIILNWDPTVLGTVSIAAAGQNWMIEQFPDDSALDGLNDSLADGDAYYSALAYLGTPQYATPSGLLVSRFCFEVCSMVTSDCLITAQQGQYTKTRCISSVDGRNVVDLTQLGWFPIGDCNANTVLDLCDIAAGTSADANGNLIPDECDGPAVCPGDANCDGQIDFGDINAFVEAIVNQVYCDGTGANADLTQDDPPQVSFGDINPFVELLTTNPLPIACP